MKLVMTLLVRDLADIVAANIEYHLSRGVDHIIVTDNGSVDETRDIVGSYAREDVTLIDEPGDDYDQSGWVTRMARLAWKMGADWVINDDADELWWPHDGDLKAVFASVPPEAGSVVVPRANFLPVRRLAGHAFEEMVYRDVVSVNGLGRPLQPKVAHRAAPDVTVAPGNHAVESAALGPAVVSDDILIFHYPHRSYEQLERKIATGGPAVERNTRVSKAMFDVWRELYKRLRAGKLRAWYDALPHANGAGFEEALASGAIVHDDRVARYMRRSALPAAARL